MDVRGIRTWLLSGLLLWAAASTLYGQAQNLSARASVRANSVFVGETFRLTVQVSGSNSPEKPTLGKLEGGVATYLGGADNSRFMRRSINGRVTEINHLGYIFEYELRATKDGRLQIPPIEIKADGKSVRTQPLSLLVRKPSESDDFKLLVSLSKEKAYVGEQLVLEAVFYLRKNVNRFSLAAPITSNPAFETVQLESDNEQTTKTLNGEQFNAVQIQRLLVVPKQAGRFDLEPETITFQGQEGTEMVRDFVGRPVRRPKYAKYVIASNKLSLEVVPLPTQGRPANFSGIVGDLSVSVQASPTNVSVGDPITLSVSLSGPPFLDPVELPPLGEQAGLKDNFKVPKEREEGTINGNYKVFTQTVRAERPEVSEIPPITVSYFDTNAGRYQVAASQPIPLEVKATRVLTSGDAEGVAGELDAQQELQSALQGIAHNYRDAGALASQPLGFAGLTSPGRLAFLAIPPALYALLFMAVMGKRKREANPEKVRARRALGSMQRDLASASTSEEVITVFCRYLGDKLTMTSSALTYRDVEGALRERKVEGTVLEGIRSLFDAGEASRYAGGSGEGNVAEHRESARKWAAELEKVLR